MNVQGVAATLESTFHHDRSIRKQAEETLKQFRGQPKFPQLLLHIIVTDGITEPVKKAAAIFFKNLAKYHWGWAFVKCT